MYRCRHKQAIMDSAPPIGESPVHIMTSLGLVKATNVPSPELLCIRTKTTICLFSIDLLQPFTKHPRPARGAHNMFFSVA